MAIIGIFCSTSIGENIKDAPDNPSSRKSDWIIRNFFIRYLAGYRIFLAG
jgi:hypothetical protein